MCLIKNEDAWNRLVEAYLPLMVYIAVCFQLLKYVPTSEEMQLLTELGGETENLARADRFLFEMGK